jgi:trehalose 6-phosphate phosphatase
MARLAHAPATDLVLISGRARKDLATVSGATGIALLVGSHGQELGAELVLSDEEAQRVTDVRVRTARTVAGIPGLRLEDKPAGLAIHVRGCTDADADTALTLVRGLSDELEGAFCLEGKLVIELSTRPLDKGAALGVLIAADPGRRVLLAGDDITDESAMAVLRTDDIAIRVGGGQTLARYRVPDPQSMLEVLSVLAHARAVGSTEPG